MLKRNRNYNRQLIPDQLHNCETAEKQNVGLYKYLQQMTTLQPQGKGRERHTELTFHISRFIESNGFFESQLPFAGDIMILAETNITELGMISEGGSTSVVRFKPPGPHKKPSFVAALVRSDTESFSSPRGKFADKSATGAP